MIYEKMTWYVVASPAGVYDGYSMSDRIVYEYVNCYNANNLVIMKFIGNEDGFNEFVADRFGIRQGSNEEYKIRKIYNKYLDANIYISDRKITHMMYVYGMIGTITNSLSNCSEKVERLSKYCHDKALYKLIYYFKNFQIYKLIDDRLDHNGFTIKLSSISNPIVDWYYVMAVAGYVYVDRPIDLLPNKTTRVDRYE